MITERDMVMALPGIITGMIVISVAVWLYYAFTRPKNKCIAILLNGLAIISFLVGESISNGPNPKHYYGGFRYARVIPNGPSWGIIAGTALAAVLMLVAYYFARKRS